MMQYIAAVAAICIAWGAQAQTVGPAQPGETCNTLNASCENYCKSTAQNPVGCERICKARMDECRSTGIYKGSAKHTIGLKP